MPRELTFPDRAAEISQFLGIPEPAALAELSLGFGTLHGKVAEDFRRANPQTDDELLAWYRTTTRYIYELSAYHSDEGFAYDKMCQGIALHLQHHLPSNSRVLALGDGIGDLTRVLIEHGINAIYHDLYGSLTAAFAEFRLRAWIGRIVDTKLSTDFNPRLPHMDYDAVVSLDFLEHVPNVEEWAREIYWSLKTGGRFLAQNAFNIGSGPDGSIPMHLTVNDRFEHDWLPLLEKIGFRPDGVSGWWIRP